MGGRGSRRSTRPCVRCRIPCQHHRTTSSARAHRTRAWWTAGAVLGLALLVLACPLFLLPKLGLRLRRSVTWLLAVLIGLALASLAVAMAPTEQLVLPAAPAGTTVAAANQDQPSSTTIERQQTLKRRQRAARRARRRADRAAGFARTRERDVDRFSAIRATALTRVGSLAGPRARAARKAQRLQARLDEMRACDVKTDIYGCALVGEE